MAADAEAIVVGGGPAGSTIAAALAGAGHRVLLLDKARFPRDKACSDYVNPGGAAILADLGVLDDVLRLGATRMKGMVVRAPGGACFVADYARAEPGQAALGLSRRRLDHLLLERARAAGVTVCENAHVRAVEQAGDRITGVVASIGGTEERLRAPLVIGADGRHSVLRRDLGLEAVRRWPRKTALAAHYRGVTGLDRYGEMHVGRGLYAGLAILEQGLVNLTVVVPSATLAARTGSVETFFAAAIARLPGVAARVAGAERVSGLRGVGDLACHARRTSGDGYLLVGDAASFLDPFAGEGIHDALQGALLAAPVAIAALRAGDTSAAALAPYRAARRQAFATRQAVSWIVQGFVNTPWAMDYVTSRLAAREQPGVTLSGVLGNLRPAGAALSPLFLARLLRP